MKKDVKFELIREYSIRDRYNEIIDWESTIVATSQTIAGLLKYARMKKLNTDNHVIEKNWKEFNGGYWIPESEVVGHLNDLIHA